MLRVKRKIKQKNFILSNKSTYLNFFGQILQNLFTLNNVDYLKR